MNTARVRALAHPFVVVLVIGLMASACDADASGTISSLVGRYTVDTHTWNATSCETEGAPVSGHPFMVIAVKTKDFREWVNAALCTDDGDCANAADEFTIWADSFWFDVGDDAMGWSGESHPESIDSGTCSGDYTKLELWSIATDRVRVEVRRTPVSYPESDAGGCTLEDAKTAAEEAGCGSLEAIEATLLESP